MEQAAKSNETLLRRRLAAATCIRVLGGGKRQRGEEQGCAVLAKTCVECRRGFSKLRRTEKQKSHFHYYLLSCLL
eukprot:scaffold3016_cov114-Skeletonema_dohrnii-CCMP3373.AAC.2